MVAVDYTVSNYRYVSIKSKQANRHQDVAIPPWTNCIPIAGITVGTDCRHTLKELRLFLDRLGGYQHWLRTPAKPATILPNEQVGFSHISPKLFQDIWHT